MIQEQDITLFTSLKGKLLIAAPSMPDTRFTRSVVYMCAHDKDHAMGFMINRPSDLRAPALFQQLNIEGPLHIPDRAVMEGGPLDQERGFVLHSDDYAWEGGTLNVDNGIALTTTRHVLDALVCEDKPTTYMLALGYTGWSRYQLDNELKTNTWLIGEASHALLFGENHKDKWEEALSMVGVNHLHLSSYSGHA